MSLCEYCDYSCEGHKHSLVWIPGGYLIQYEDCCEKSGKGVWFVKERSLGGGGVRASLKPNSESGRYLGKEEKSGQRKQHMSHDITVYRFIMSGF